MCEPVRGFVQQGLATQAATAADSDESVAAVGVISSILKRSVAGSTKCSSGRPSVRPSCISITVRLRHERT